MNQPPFKMSILLTLLATKLTPLTQNSSQPAWQPGSLAAWQHGSSCSAYLVAILEMKVGGFWVETQVNTLPVVSDDVLCPWVDIVTFANQFLQPAKWYMLPYTFSQCIVLLHINNLRAY